MSRAALKRIVRFLPGIVPLLLVFPVYADDVYRDNKEGNRLYEKGEYGEAVKKYEDALVSSPGNSRVYLNKGTAHFKAGQYEEALESYDKASGIKEKDAEADLYYNKGTALFTKAESSLRSGQPDMETYKKAKESFIQSLDMRPSDRDAKWNLELVQSRIKQLEEQQKDQDKSGQDNKDKQDDKNRRNDKQDKENQQDQNKKEQDNKQQDQKNKDGQQKDKKDSREKKQQEEKKREKKQNRSAEEGDKKEKERPLPTPEEKKEDMEKRKAARLIQQYADDAKELKKPQENMIKPKAGGTEKDW